MNDGNPVLRMDTLIAYVSTVSGWLHLGLDPTTIPVGSSFLYRSKSFLEKLLCLECWGTKDYNYSRTVDRLNLITKLMSSALLQVRNRSSEERRQKMRGSSWMVLVERLIEREIQNREYLE
jgi:hypothetical protein